MEVWGFLDDSEALAPVFDTYKKLNPQISNIEYRKLSTDTYKKELIDALASGQGPDIFLVHNTWTPGFSDKIVPAPADIINEQKFRQEFVDVVANDFLTNGSIYAVPLSVDSLGLYYNKDLFNEAGITSPPKDWNQFVDDVRRLTKINNFGEIVQSGAAVGTAYNINRSTDILSLLMLQSGTNMVEGKGVVFNLTRMVGNESISSGENALNFYTQFARLSSPNYTWNSKLHYSLDSFSEGTVAMMFNYSWHIPTIESKSPKLNFAVAPIPQFPGSSKVNYANYWAYAVAKNKLPEEDITGENTGAAQPTNEQRTKEAWKFLNFLAMKPSGNISIVSSISGDAESKSFDPAAVYLEKTKRPAARRDLIENQKTDPKIGVFAQDNLVAKSWYQKDPEATEAILAEVIDQVNRGQLGVYEAIEKAAMRITNLMK